MAKRLTAVFCIVFILLSLSVAVYSEGIQEVNIRQMYLYTDAMHTYVEMNGADGQPVSEPEAKGIYASLDTDKLSVKKIQSFTDSGEGMAYIFMIDISGSLSSSQFRQLKNATKTWAEKMGEKDRLAILTFGDEAKVIQDFTNDVGAVRASLDGISNNDGRTKLFGGIEEALKLASRNDADLPKRKAIILLTDGVNDYAGGIDEATALQMAKETLIPVYSIWTPGLKRGVGEAFLNTLSDTTNGTIYNLSKKDIDSIYTTAYEQFQKAFVVDFSYSAGKADGNTHQLKITVRYGDKEASDDTECVLKKPTSTLATVPINTVSAESEGGENTMSPIILISIIVVALVLIALIIFVFAMLNRKPKEVVRSNRTAYPQYTPENANIPRNETASAPVVQQQNISGGIAFTMHEIGGQDIKSGCVNDTLIVGRRSDCGLVIQDSQISGQHCKLIGVDGTLAIEDMGSTNGTIVNGMTVPGRTKLSSGDLILLGNKEYRITF